MFQDTCKLARKGHLGIVYFTVEVFFAEIGTSCDIVNVCEIDTPRCENGGSCSPPSSVDGEFTCRCVAGYTGKTCQIDIDECKRANGDPTCRNGATCNDTVNAYTCTCAEGYSGTCYAWKSIKRGISLRIRDSY